MSVWAIVPVKPLNRAKSRLASVLSPEMRYEFARMMLQQVLSTLSATPEVTGTLVISRDTKALSMARDLGAKTIQEGSPSELNPALIRATELVRMWRADALLIIPADLPFVNSYDLSGIIQQGQYGLSVVLATDYERDGTNAMLVRPPGLIHYAYGEGSFARHMEMAENAGASIHIYESELLKLDVDIPEDLEAYNRVVKNGNYEFLSPFMPDLVN